MARSRRPWSSLVAALRDPSRSEFAFVPHQYLFAAPEVAAALASSGGLSGIDGLGGSSSLSPMESTPINDARSKHADGARARDGHRDGAFQLQRNAFFALHMLALAVAGTCGAWLSLFPISPTRLYNIQIDVFRTDQDHTRFFFAQCLALGAVFGAACAGFLGDRLGRAGTLELAAVPFVIGWMMVGLAYGEATVLVGRYLLGIASGMVSVVVPIYVAEVSASHARGRLLCLQALYANIGRLVYLAIGVSFVYLSREYVDFNLIDWKVLALIGLAPGLLLLILMQKLPDSPTWLIVSHDDRETAFHVVHRLFSEDARFAEQEVNRLVHANILSREDHTHHGAFFRPLLLCCALFTLRAIASHLIEPVIGTTPTKTFMVTIFGVGLDVSEEELLAVHAFLWVASSLGMLACFFLIDIRGRIVALQSGCSLVLVACALVLVNAYRQQQTSIRVTDTGSATLLLITAGHQLGLGLGPVVLASELFPARQRMGAVSVVVIWESAMHLALSYLLPWLGATLSFDHMFTLGVVLVLVSNGVGLVISWFHLPETSQCSLQAIEAILSGWYPLTPPTGQSRVWLSAAMRYASGSRSHSYGT